MPDKTLPSIATILQSTNKLSAPDASATVVRVGEDIAVKYGVSVDLLEARNMEYVSEHSKVPIPKLYGTMTEESTGRNFIVMELVKGETLAKAWPRLNPFERREVVDQLRQALADLRGMPSPGYIGSVGRQACADGVFWTGDKPPNPLLSGPFDTEDDMNEGILRRISASNQPEAYLALLRTLFSSTLHSHQVFFTHADLQPRNIMVERTNSATSGMTSLKVWIIDWEISGWYPEYWEFCNAPFNPDWLETVRSILPTCSHEYLMMQVIRSLLFY